MTSRYVICNWRDTRHPRAGGAEVCCEHLAHQLARADAQVVLLTSRHRGAPRREVTAFGEVVRLGGALSTYPLALLWLVRHRRYVDGVIDSENGIPYFAPLAVRRSTPVVLLMHHVHQEQFEYYLPPVARLVARWLERTVAGRVYRSRPVCAVSPSTRSEIRRHLNFRGPVFITPNGNLATPKHRDAGCRSRAPRLVVIGRLVRHKRVDLLLRTLPDVREAVPDLVVDIVGDGPDRDRLERIGYELGGGGAVRFHGRLSDQDRDRIVSQAWVSVNTSLGEGWSMSVIDAAALGVPTIGLQVAGLQDSIQHGRTGWLCQSEGGLALAITGGLDAVRDEEEAARWAARCREWAARFSWERTAGVIQAILASEAERLVSQWPERRGGNDAATVVTLDVKRLPIRSFEQLRRTDLIRYEREVVELLLLSSDETDARQVLDRLGLGDRAIADLRVARPGDLLREWDVAPAAGRTSHPAGRSRLLAGRNGHGEPRLAVPDGSATNGEILSAWGPQTNGR